MEFVSPCIEDIVDEEAVSNGPVFKRSIERSSLGLAREAK